MAELSVRNSTFALLWTQCCSRHKLMSVASAVKKVIAAIFATT